MKMINKVVFWCPQCNKRLKEDAIHEGRIAIWSCRQCHCYWDSPDNVLQTVEWMMK